MCKVLAFTGITNLRIVSDLRCVFRDGEVFPRFGQGGIRMFLVANFQEIIMSQCSIMRTTFRQFSILLFLV